MVPTFKAILARFNGHKEKARVYCLHIVADYAFKNSTLAREYLHHAQELEV